MSLLRLRRSSGLVRFALQAFVFAITVLPYLHTVNHRDDHEHVDGGIVHRHQDAPSGDHGRRDLAHCGVGVLPPPPFVLPLPAMRLEGPTSLPPSASGSLRFVSPRLTRGPPA